MISKRNHNIYYFVANINILQCNGMYYNVKPKYTHNFESKLRTVASRQYQNMHHQDEKEI